ncbi:MULTISPECIES: hypothetical protein [unclassified Lysobacter]|uniref:hypothetical protein n=1 Tax=unclassified Lysobacter TaxID=2635362 RepID=UPI00138F469D|nr:MULTISPECIES: hypothetical protein [unclassified Lysobacter]
MLKVGQNVDGAAIARCGHALARHSSAIASHENQEKKTCEGARGVSTLCAEN